MATIMSHNLPLIPLPLKASAAALAKAGLMMPGSAGLLGGALGLPEPPERSPPAAEIERHGAGSKLTDEADETDRMSCCSDDSELSVGQEVPDDLRAPTAATTTEEMSNDSSRYSKDTGSELDFVRLHQHQHQQNQSQPQPPGMLRPSPTRLHEEFLRNSQLYAEELMRQQMQIVAAARGLAMTSPGSKSPLEAMANSPVGLVTARNLHQDLHRSRSPLQGFRPARDTFRPDSASSPANEPPASVAAASGGSFRGLHSHLSAISAITQNLNSDLSKLTSPTAFAAGSARTSRESSQSPPTATGLHQLHQQQQQQQQQYHPQHYLNQQYPPHHHHHHHHQLALAALNNNIANALHDQSLKFSIDNILKADFGRRITDPLLLKRTPKGAPSGRKANDKTPSAIDLSGAVAGCPQQQQQQQQESPALVSTSSTSSNLSVAVSTASVSKSFCPRSSSSSSSSRASSGSVSSVGSVGSEDVVSPMSPLSSTGSLKGDGVGAGSGSGTATASANSATNGSGGGAGANGASSSSGASASGGGSSSSSSGPMVWPAWVYCTRYSDRPSSGPRTRKPKKSPAEKGAGGVQAAGSGSGSGGAGGGVGGGSNGNGGSAALADDKRPRTAFSGPQLARLKHEFAENRYLTERRRQQLSAELGLNEAQIKIWFQNKRAKIKKSSGHKNPLALQLMAQGLYNHSTVPLTREEEELQEMQAAAAAAAESRTGSAGPAAAAAVAAAAAAAAASASG